MRNLPIIFLGIFFTLSFSWVGLVLTSHIQLAPLEVATLEVEEVDGEAVPVEGATFHPQAPVGQAARGKQVYISMGCVYCHSQQVRRPDFGTDWLRGWGNRQTVARDYIRQDRVLLGTMRTGPDLMNVGERIPTEQWHHLHLYYPKLTSEGSLMPPFQFLYDVRRIPESGPSPNALDIPEVTAGGLPVHDDWIIPEGFEVVPTQAAEDLVAYLLSLRLDYELPEMKFTE